MAYTKTNWKARQCDNPNKFTKLEETADTVVLINTPGSVSEPGTLFSPENMNHLEKGVGDAHDAIAAESAARQAAIVSETGARQSAITIEAQERDIAIGKHNSSASSHSDIRNLMAQINEAQHQVEYLTSELYRNLIDLDTSPLMLEDGSYLVTESGEPFLVDVARSKEANARQVAINNAVVALTQRDNELALQLGEYKSLVEYLIQFIKSKHDSLGALSPLMVEDGSYLVIESGDYIAA